MAFLIRTHLWKASRKEVIQPLTLVEIPSQGVRTRMALPKILILIQQRLQLLQLMKADQKYKTPQHQYAAQADYR